MRALRSGGEHHAGDPADSESPGGRARLAVEPGHVVDGGHGDDRGEPRWAGAGRAGEPGAGFPAWYEDSCGRRLEPCVDHQNPLCDIPVDNVPNPSAPMSFPGNLPSEVFHQLVAADVALRGGGGGQPHPRPGGAWLNEEVTPGDQTVFARIRVDVDGVPGATYTFEHPFGELIVDTDTDADGRGRFVQDVSPALSNFDTPLARNIGPFLRWRPNVLPNPPAGYVGDPTVLHRVTGSSSGYNRFTAWQGALQEGTTDLFSVSGKIATNTGPTVAPATINDGSLHVFATSKGAQLEVAGQDGRFASTPMLHDRGGDRHYAASRWRPAPPCPPR